MKLKIFSVLAVVCVLLTSCEVKKEPAASPGGEQKMQIELTSPAFEDGEMIPAKYTADGQNISPPLKWTSTLDKTISFALICDDPDAPGGTWVHWVIYNIPPDKRMLDEGVPGEETLPRGMRQGTTDFDDIGYGGPAPPSGTHRYFFKIYALDRIIDTNAVLDKETLLQEMEGRILAQTQLMGKYKRQ